MRDDSSQHPQDADLERLLGNYVERVNAGEILDKERIAAEHPDVAPYRQSIAYI